MPMKKIKVISMFKRYMIFYLRTDLIGKIV